MLNQHSKSMSSRHINIKGFIALMMAILFFAQPNQTLAQQGTTHTNNSISSEILGQEVPYSVYLPPSYHTSERPYPVLYLLHGAWGNYLDWVYFGDVQHIANEAFKDPSIPEMIIVMPDGFVDIFYQNQYDGSLDYEDFFVEEFIPEIEQSFRTMAKHEPLYPDGQYRSIAGLSMGGYGAMYYALKYPQMFSSAYSMSGGFVSPNTVYPSWYNKDDVNERFESIWGPMENGIQKNFNQNTIQTLAQTFPDDQIPLLPVLYIDCGDDDWLLPDNLEVYDIMRDRGFNVELRINDGAHTQEYWRAALPKAIRVAGQSFRGW